MTNTLLIILLFLIAFLSGPSGYYLYAILSNEEK